MRLLSPLRGAFTLIELLVVVAIIGVLVALLLPAIQKVREAASRLQCQSNMKQLGIALVHYHDVHACFPSGSKSPNRGPSWAVLVLPFLEQGDAYSKIDFTKPMWRAGPDPEPNRQAFADFEVRTFICPSSPLSASRIPDPYDTGVSYTQLVGHYVAIMGAVTSSSDFHDPTGRGRAVDTTYPDPQLCAFGGYVASNGVIFPSSAVRIGDIRDGASNTIMLGEQSGLSVRPPMPLCYGQGDPGDPRADLRTARAYGIWAGDEDPTTPTESNDPNVMSKNAKAKATDDINSYIANGSSSTVRWPLGLKIRQNYQDGMGYYGSWNSPIQSAHPGGAFVLRCDAGVTFLQESITFDVLKWLSIRDDGQIFEW